MTDEWKDVAGFEGRYQVSSMGQIRSLCGRGRRGKATLMKCSLGTQGYVKVGLFRDGTTHHFLVHRLVAAAFLGNPNEYPAVNHKNENKIDNRASNLEWCTYAYNNNYGTGHLRAAITKGRKIRAVRIDSGVGREYYSISEASKQLGIAHGGICECVNGKRSQFMGYNFYPIGGGKNAG